MTMTSAMGFLIAVPIVATIAAGSCHAAESVPEPDAAQVDDQDLADGAAAGITATPTTIVRNNRSGASEAVVGALPVDALARTIDRVLGSYP